MKAIYLANKNYLSMKLKLYISLGREQVLYVRVLAPLIYKITAIYLSIQAVSKCCMM